MLVDERTLLLRAESPAIVAAAERELGPGRIKTELFACVVESNTGACATAGEAAAQLGELRGAAAGLAGTQAMRILAAGSHPISRPEEQAIVPEERYIAFVDYAGISARRQGVNGLHVHVGMPDADTCMRALEGVLPVAPGRARRVRELAVPRRRGDGPRLQPRRGARAAAPQRRAAARSATTRSGRRSSAGSSPSG